jgi:hypothetical protein
MRQEGTPLDHETDHSQSEIERPKLKRKEAAGAVRPRKIADVRAALSRAFPGRWRDRDLRPQHRAGVEYVMGFCTKEQHRHFLEVCPAFEKQIVDNGIRLIKYWLEVSNKKQKRRFEARIDDRMRQWKLSPMDLPSRERWYDYSRARLMLEATDTDYAPWHIVRSDDKKRARLNLISHFLSLIPYEQPKRDKVKLPSRDKKHAYDDEATIKNRRLIEEKVLILPASITPSEDAKAHQIGFVLQMPFVRLCCETF